MALYEFVKPELISRIETFSKKHGIGLGNLIKKEENRRNMESYLTEAHFGLYLDTIGNNIKYNTKIANSKTPDFVFSRCGQEVILEVVRINPVKDDIARNDAEEEEIIKFQQMNPGEVFKTKPQSIKWKPEKLIGNKGEIVNKAMRYEDAVNKEDMPFIIGVYMSFESAIDSLDLTHGLYGSTTALSGKHDCDGFVVGAPFRMLEKALFYNNESVRKTVSGVLLRDHDGKFKFFANYSSSNKLNSENWNFFQTIQIPIK